MQIDLKALWGDKVLRQLNWTPTTCSVAELAIRAHVVGAYAHVRLCELVVSSTV